jgi:TPR repeat protein
MLQYVRKNPMSRYVPLPGRTHVAAVKWYRLAAEHSNASAQNHLGDMYADGRGVPKDNVLAYIWFNLARAVNSRDRVLSHPLISSLQF